MHTSDFRGDADHPIPCTGDACVGDRVAFDQAVFTGSFRRAKFAGYRRITGTIVADSYGAARQQHTFTLLLPDNSKMRIKGRNLYANGAYRAPWPDEGARRAALADKHARGDRARAARDARKAGDQ